MLAGIALIAVVAGMVSAERRRRRQAASLNAIDFVRASFASRLARGEPMDELLIQVVDALCDALRLDAAEIWLHEDGVLKLAASAPRSLPSEMLITPEEQSIVANAQVSGPAWARTWLPALLEKKPPVSLRIAPVSESGQLLGLIVTERRSNGERLAKDADVILDELARELGASLHKLRLDASLQASLRELRRHARELQASRARIVVAADEERRRIERDLHDGAQQYLVAIAVKARLIEKLARTDPARSMALTEELNADVEAALDELRTLAHGIYPPLLSSEGLEGALAAACRRSTMPVRLEASGVRRYQPEIEAAVYYCCLEALQNAVKYAGEGAGVAVKVWEDGPNLRFEVADDGAGFDPEHRAIGAGLTNMSDRMGAVGGTLEVESAGGAGTRVHGAVALMSRLADGNAAGLTEA